MDKKEGEKKKRNVSFVEDFSLMLYVYQKCISRKNIMGFHCQAYSR